MAAFSYQRYLRSEEWEAKRIIALRRAGDRCQDCGYKLEVQVHHLTYDRLGHERPEDLMVLCQPCHAQLHGRSPRAGPVAGKTEADFSVDSWAKWRDARLAETADVVATIQALHDITPGGRERKRLRQAMRIIERAAE